MPHVVLTGSVAMEELFRALRPIMIRKDQDILRTMDAFMNVGKTSILIESLAVEAGRKTSFLTLVSSRDDGVVVRLYPRLEVEKTEGVKMILAEQAKQILASLPALSTGETNLSSYLE
jgi:hypothetical protein